MAIPLDFLLLPLDFLLLMDQEFANQNSFSIKYELTVLLKVTLVTSSRWQASKEFIYLMVLFLLLTFVIFRALAACQHHMLANIIYTNIILSPAEDRKEVQRIDNDI